MAFSTLSLGMLAARAFCSARRKAGLLSTFGPNGLYALQGLTLASAAVAVGILGAVARWSGWTTLLVATRGNGNLRVFIDSTQVYSTNITTLANANMAGLFNNSGGLGLVNRWDNFMVSEPGP